MPKQFSRHGEAKPTLYNGNIKALFQISTNRDTCPRPQTMRKQICRQVLLRWLLPHIWNQWKDFCNTEKNHKRCNDMCRSWQKLRFEKGHEFEHQIIYANRERRPMVLLDPSYQRTLNMPYHSKIKTQLTRCSWKIEEHNFTVKTAFLLLQKREI